MATVRPLKRRKHHGYMVRSGSEGHQIATKALQDRIWKTNMTEASLLRTLSTSYLPTAAASATPSDTPDQTVRSLYAPSTIVVSASSPSKNSTAPTGPTVTIQATGNEINGISTLRTTLISSTTLIPDPGTKLDIEVLPGVNQNDPLLGMVPKVTPFANTHNSAAPPPMPIATVDRPMPGKNQPKPTIDAIANLPPVVSNPPTPIPTPSVSSTKMTVTSLEATTSAFSSVLASIATSADYSTLRTSFSISPSISSASSLSFAESPTTSSLSSLSWSSSFFTISRTEQAKEQLPSTSTSAPTSEALTTISPSSSVVFSSPPVVVITTAPPNLSTPVSAEPQRGLTPLTRSLFILFGVLGAISIPIALGVVWMMRRYRKRAQSVQQRSSNEEPRTNEEYGVTTRILANNSISQNPFLTESEKAIVTRATMPDGEPDANITTPSARFTDAIDSFVAKSRRLTYKITP